MNVGSYSGMMKLFAVELVILIISIYIVTIAVMDGIISQITGLVILGIVMLSNQIVDYFVLYL